MPIDNFSLTLIRSYHCLTGHSIAYCFPDFQHFPQKVNFR